jgi:hypothetical protein
MQTSTSEHFNFGGPEKYKIRNSLDNITLVHTAVLYKLKTNKKWMADQHRVMIYSLNQISDITAVIPNNVLSQKKIFLLTVLELQVEKCGTKEVRVTLKVYLLFRNE